MSVKKHPLSRFFACIFFFAFLLLLLPGCQEKVTSIEFAQNEMVMQIGETQKLQTNVYPLNAPNLNYDIISADDNIVQISGNDVTALAEGTAILIIRQDDIDFDTCIITVRSVLPERLSFSSQMLDLHIGETVPLRIDISPENTTDKHVTYTSSNPAIARVDGEELIGVSGGSVIITATHASGLHTDCFVNVSPVDPERIEIDGPSSMGVGTTEEISIRFYPEDTTDKSVVWESEDASILSVIDGTVSANRIGTAMISATHASGIKTTKQIEVLPLYGDKVIITNGSTGSLYETESILLSAEISPRNAIDQTIQWSSDDPSIATVDNGKVTGVRSGKTFIRATTANKVVAAYSITVKPSTKFMRVSITKTCSNYNHVGNEWSFYFSINGDAISSGDRISVTRNENIRIYTEVTENDKYDDVGTDSENITVTTESFENGFTVTQTISVMENRGRYSGNVAVWTVKYTFN